MRVIDRQIRGKILLDITTEQLLIKKNKCNNL